MKGILTMVEVCQVNGIRNKITAEIKAHRLTQYVRCGFTLLPLVSDNMLISGFTFDCAKILFVALDMTVSVICNRFECSFKFKPIHKLERRYRDDLYW